MVDTRYLVTILNDQEEVLESLAELFDKEGYELSLATNYEQLLFCLEEEIPVLLVIDFRSNEQMSKDALLRIRGEERYRDIPVLGLFDVNAFEQSQDDRYWDVGMDHICHAPFSKRDILVHSEHLVEFARLKKVLELKELAIEGAYRTIDQLKDEIIKKDQQLQQLNETLRQVNVIDQLTGLFNAGYVFEQLDIAISRFNRHGARATICLCEIDNYEQIKETKDEKFCDWLVRQVGIVLTSNKRQQDIVGRYKDHSYIMLLSDTPAIGARFFGERTSQIVSSYSFSESLQLTMSFGFAVYDQIMPVEMLLSMATDALDVARKKGVGSVVVANEEIGLKDVKEELHM